MAKKSKKSSKKSGNSGKGENRSVKQSAKNKKVASGTQEGKGRKEQTAKQPPKDLTLILILWSGLFFVIGLAFLISMAFPGWLGAVGEPLNGFLRGVCGYAGYAAAIFFILGSLFLRGDVINRRNVFLKIVFALVTVSIIAMYFHIGVGNDPVFDSDSIGNYCAALYRQGSIGFGGGILGGIFFSIFGFLGTFGLFLISIPVLLLTTLGFFGMTPISFFGRIRYLFNVARTRRDQAEEAARPAREARRAEEEQRRQAAEALALQHQNYKQERMAERRRARQLAQEQRAAEIEARRKKSMDPDLYVGLGTPAARPVSETSSSGQQQPVFAPEIRDDDFTDKKRKKTSAVKPEAAETEKVSTPSVQPDPSPEIGPPPASRDSLPEFPESTEPLSETSTAGEEDEDISSPLPDQTAAASAAPSEAPDETAQLLASLNAAYQLDSDRKPAPEPPPPPPYLFPPVSLLHSDLNQTSEDTSQELRENGERLVEILKSFHVNTRVVAVSRGPTITRYELQPDAGVRVRSVANLVDDIALGMAASGIRIEAPIPGKSAIGVEVPNRNVATVYIRSLIDTPAFRSAKSKLTTCLGMDVAGAPIYLDIAKMPHLLISGATGMGKSVCINSLIISLLYKAAPEDCRLILIDPKKVELNMYSGIPHLLVPVVSDPKKAAGSLHWAVTEMERRFELIEDVGMRNIQGYNDITKNDPDREHLPHIVIIIDELADLMMTAPDDVEQNICRLAQKARAAGMHLVIGTQRPSVDVITGLIKANVPSRIAFHVSSQMDSRVILDISGAEKLLGRGDMLYAPVGSSKPTRVQGAFVSEEEIDDITAFIKQNSGQIEYSEAIISTIDKEAALCGQKKGSHPDSEGEDSLDGDGDPMLINALELALESGKISTSLIQRRLSLGYGRAAKLIDLMEQKGYVSAPDGQKPRQVLITREQYQEMRMRSDPS